MIILICAAAKNGVIGKNGKIPWNFKTDLKNFRKLTMGNILVLGRKTYESLPKTLDGRKLIILTKNENYFSQDSIVNHSPHYILDNYLKSKDKCFIGGGAQIFDFFVDYAEKIYLTEIGKDFIGDAYFPLEKLNCFKEISCKEIEEKGVILKFKVLQRK
jgi:dihydrofolate reductase